MAWQPQPAHVCSAQTLALVQAMRDLAASARREAASLEEAIERGLEDVRLREIACAQRERNVDAQEAECDHQRRAVAHLCDVVWAHRRRGLDAKQTAGRACSPHRWLELLGADENDAGRVPRLPPPSPVGPVPRLPPPPSWTLGQSVEGDVEATLA
ncbi:MAG: hypothetical protein ACPIOQ_17085, partial [Promethearchaeia archaeon]